MTGESQGDTPREIRRVLRAYHDAMISARTDDLDRLLDSGFLLVHITGYEQPKREWFGVMRSGQFDYHRIDVDEEAVSVKVTDSTAVVTGQGMFSATINGMNAPWRLQFTMAVRQRGDAWTIMHARYTM